ncbi:transcriptional regulator [Buttiauxella gaviniae]|uniref:transcriptional regulator n=1 Tax=Buttiauxella gaviniae TaxID=82990 RepID=UPI0007E4C453|nr:YdaS family helix-turn-helix protein [Buttiauxella gaviniae]
MTTTYKNITDKAVRTVGRVSTVARLFNFKTSQSVANWIERNKVPSERVIKLCELGGWVVTPHELRPDLYPEPTHGLPTEQYSITQAS